jgi:hypothetical protein
MPAFFGALGIREGRSLYYGPIGVGGLPAAPAARGEDGAARGPSAAAAAKARRRAAAAELVNIGPEERLRRDRAGNVMAYATVAYAAYSAVFGDSGDLTGHLLRFLVAVPLFFAVGYKQSASEGKLVDLAGS